MTPVSHEELPNSRSKLRHAVALSSACAVVSRRPNRRQIIRYGGWRVGTPANPDRFSALAARRLPPGWDGNGDSGTPAPWLGQRRKGGQPCGAGVQAAAVAAARQPGQDRRRGTGDVDRRHGADPNRGRGGEGHGRGVGTMTH
jgi:hypothetical protein